MKPDKHKQKQSTKYKKAHGIKDDKTTNNLNDNAASKCNPKGKEKCSDVGDKRQPHATSLPNSGAKASTEEARSGHISNQDVDSSRLFSRRKMVSNWDRYEEMELQDEDTLPTVRGQDFNQLLQGAGASVSQFRLKSEEEWEVDGSAETADLSLNLVELAEALQCVPLHRVLGVSEDLLLPEQIHTFTQEASAHSSRLLENTEEETTSTVAESDSPEPVHGAVEPTKDVLDDILSDTLFSDEQTIQINKSDSSRVISNRKEIAIDDITNDLDDLLSMGTTHYQPSDLANPAESILSDDIDLLDDILSNDSTEKNNQVNCDKSVLNSRLTSKQVDGDNQLEGKTETVFKPSVTENLDEWLDSMLDD